jgi:predicted permease
LWQSTFAGDARIVGRQLTLDGLDYVIAGVMPAGFSGHTAEAVDIWVTFEGALRTSPEWETDEYRSLATLVVRTRPQFPVNVIDTQVQAAVDQQVSLSPIAGVGIGANERRVAWWLTGTSVLVLVMGLVNAGTLLNVRADKRRRDLAIYASLGASRERLLTQTLLESTLLAGTATMLAALAASWFDEIIRRVLFPDLNALAGFSSRAIWLTAVVGLLTLIAAMLASTGSLRSATRRAGLAHRARGALRRRTWSSLLILQTALSVVMLAGTGMFARSLHSLVSQDFGMTMDDVVLVDFQRPGSELGDVMANAVDRIRTLPGVEVATPITSIPFGGHHVPPISVPGRDESPSVDHQLPFLNAATPEYLDILGIRIVDGRPFTADDERGAPVVIVNETMAREVWPGERAVGKCIRIGFDDDFDPSLDLDPQPSAKVVCREVVGVAKDIRQRSLLPAGNEARLMQYFVPFSQVPYPSFVPPGRTVSGVLLRTSADLEQLAPMIRRALTSDRKDVPFIRVVPYKQLLEPQLKPWRTATTLLALFSALALGVAMIGLYAVFAHAVSERRHEMAVRVAIGARPALVLRMVLREAVLIAGAGCVVGAVASVFAGKAVQALLFETSSADPVTLGGVTLLMLIACVGATVVPAAVASNADPSTLLKEGGQR